MKNEKRDDEKRDDDTCVKCEKTFNRSGGGTYDGVLSYCNDCYATRVVLILARKMTKLWIQQLVLSDLFLCKCPH